MKRDCTWQFVVIACVCVITGACGKTPPRTIGDIERDLASLPALFLTDKTQREVLAPAKKGPAFVDTSSGEIAWVAYTCTNPDCPGKGQGKNGRPFLFIWNDPTAKIQPDGTLFLERRAPEVETYAAYIERLGGHAVATCPACLAQRNRATETPQQQQRYSDWVRIYVPPEATQRRQELEAERKAWMDALDERSKRKAPSESAP